MPSPAAAGRIVSPTALEAWARCPHGYFMERLLGCEPLESPEELMQISPLEVGSLVHEALDRFFTEQYRRAPCPAARSRGPPTSGRRCARSRGSVAAEYTARGVTGHPLLWEQEAIDPGRPGAAARRRRTVRAQTGRRQVRSELAFGMRGAPPVEVPLPDGRTIRFRGSADRVDRAGDAIVVVDYKTGSMRAFKEHRRGRPDRGGTKLQLPVYAYAARAALDAARRTGLRRVLVPPQGPRQRIGCR